METQTVTATMCSRCKKKPAKAGYGQCAECTDYTQGRHNLYYALRNLLGIKLLTRIVGPHSANVTLRYEVMRARAEAEGMVNFDEVYNRAVAAAGTRVVTKLNTRLTEEEKTKLKSFGREPSAHKCSTSVGESLLPTRKRRVNEDTAPHLSSTEYDRKIITQGNMSWSYPAPLKGFYRENGGDLVRTYDTESHYPAIAVAEDEGILLTIDNVHIDNWKINSILGDSPFESEEQMRTLLAAEISRRNIEFFTEDEIGYDYVEQKPKEVPYVRKERTQS